MNQAEVVHAAWANRNETGLSLKQAAEFDTKDSLILVAELKNYEHSANSNGCGPSLVKLGKRKQHREREAVERSGQDILDFGVQEPSHSLNDNGCHPPKGRKVHNISAMFQKRLEATKNALKSMKIFQSKRINALNRTYSVKSSNSANKVYNVTISNISSCSCPDFLKNGKNVPCKHILFTIIYVLHGSEYENLLIERYLDDETLKSLLETAGCQIDREFQSEKSYRKKPFKDILSEHPLYEERQTWKLHLKTSRSAKCSNPSCKKVLTIGTECFCVDGALSVPYCSQRAVPQKFYFCVNKVCMKSLPAWSNIHTPTRIDVLFEDENRRSHIYEILDI